MADEAKAAGALDPAEAVAWERLKEMREGEAHFNELKAGCRTLASTWLLASYGAMGFLLTEQLPAGIPVEVAALCVGVAGSIGILLLWVLDVLVYHRLLDAYFYEACEIERAHGSLPQVRRHMIASQPGGQVTNYQAFFYIGASGSPLLFGGLIFVNWLRAFGNGAALSALAGLAAVLCLLAWYVRRKSPNPAGAAAKQKGRAPEE